MPLNEVARAEAELEQMVRKLSKTTESEAVKCYLAHCEARAKAKGRELQESWVDELQQQIEMTEELENLDELELLERIISTMDEIDYLTERHQLEEEKLSKSKKELRRKIDLEVRNRLADRRMKR